MVKVEDLDVLRPTPKFVRLGGKDIDVSFIPCGITFEVDQIIRELNTITQNDILNDSALSKRAFDLSIDLCVVFCSHNYPELDRAWFNENTNMTQITKFTEAISEALMKAYAGIGGDGKNLKAAKKK